MKKRKLITAISAAMLSAVALASCSTVKSKDGVVLVYDGKEYTADQLYEGGRTPAAAEAKFKAVYKVAVRRYFEEGQVGHQFMDQITIDTKNKISGQKATAQSNADKNGTSYDEEWNKILTSNNVKDESELYDKFEYELQKEKFDDKFYENNYKVLREGGKFVDEEGKAGNVGLEKGYLAAKQPYHMKHILVKLANATEGNNTSVEISSDEAIHLYNVVYNLANGMSFKDVSDLYNDDGTARDSYSSLGIMSRDTSFVNDFKLGTYLYEAFYGSSTQAKTGTDPYGSKNAAKQLGLDKSTSDEDAAHFANLIKQLPDPTTMANPHAETGNGIGQIPYEAILALGEHQYDNPTGVGKKEGLANVDLKDPKIKERFIDQAQLTEGDVKGKYLPRNVIFNKYFNKHNIMVITPSALPAGLTTATYIDSTGTKRTATPESYALNHNVDSYKNLPGFNYAAKNGDKIIGLNLGDEGQNQVLRDDNGRVILVFRSGTSGDSGYQGIHFVVIERSPFITYEFDHKDDTTNKYRTSLDEYYTHYYPGQAGGDHPIYEGTNEDKHTFVNYVMGETEAKKLKARADTVKSEFKKVDTHLEKYIFDYLKDKGELKFADTTQGKEIEATIENWKKITIEATKKDDKKNWDNTWRTYSNALEAMVEQREEVIEDGEARSYLVTEACLDAFLNATPKGEGRTLKTMFGAGGVFHE